MGCLSCRVMIILALSIAFFVSFQLDKASALSSMDLALRGSRVLLAGAMQDLHNAQMNAAAEAPSRTLDPNQSDKRTVRKGSDPIHNRC
nr:CLAVATA3/ESR (CLE)-related protein 45 [Ipomoea batatas]GMC50670.1 CLAVATA3/ESR (CLE)-related protein 45 [Ipomoea batatas]